MRSLQALLLVTTLAACGAPGADAVFTKGNPKIPAADSTKAIAADPEPRIEFKQYRGLYRRIGTDSRFQPCGTTVPLEITGTLEGLALLRERFRWMSAEPGRKMFGVFQGTILSDTIKGQGPAGGTIVVRFFITGVDSLRTWDDGDCPGMRVS